MPLVAGSTLLIDSGPAALKHLHVVVLGPMQIPGNGTAPHFVMVSITSRRQGAHFDPACVLVAGDHPFVRHESFAIYRLARAERVDHIERMISSGLWQEREPCSPQLLKRLIDGARQSDHLRGDLQRLF